jgi:hypothetical protein
MLPGGRQTGVVKLGQARMSAFGGQLARGWG